MQLDDLKKLGFSFILSFVVLKVLFYKEDITTVLRVVATFFWLFILPGIGITYLWDMEFPERFVVSVAISAAIVGIFSYYLGLLGVHVKTSAYLLPAMSIGVGLWIWKRRNGDRKNLNHLQNASRIQ